MKKQYQTPELEKFGTVSQLSAGGSAPLTEGGDANGQGRRP